MQLVLLYSICICVIRTQAWHSGTVAQSCFRRCHKLLCCLSVALFPIGKCLSQCNGRGSEDVACQARCIVVYRISVKVHGALARRQALIANCSTKLHRWICNHDKVLILPRLIHFHCTSTVGQDKYKTSRHVHGQFCMEMDPVPERWGRTGS